MGERAFIIMQIGAKESPERKRADEIYSYVVVPAVESVGLEPYRSDLDLSPGPVTPAILSGLLAARVVIADLTGKNSNVFYELGITHSFGRPLVSIADSSKSLPFDAKDERVIELGDCPPSGLPVGQAMEAKRRLQESLKIVLEDGYVPPTPLRGAAANLSIDRLAPKNPVAAELAQMRESLEEIRKSVSPRARSIEIEDAALRRVIEGSLRLLTEADFDTLAEAGTSRRHRIWVSTLKNRWLKTKRDPWDNDPWASDSVGYSDEPPF